MPRTVRAVAFAGAAALCVTLAACGGGSGGGAVVTVNGQTISRTDFDSKLENSPQARQVLQTMVQQHLVDQYATDHHINVPQSEIDAKEAQIKSRYPAGQFDAMIKQQGLTQNDVQNILREQIVLEKAVAPQIHVTDADVRAYFDKNRAMFDKPEQVQARHILVADKATAEKVLAQLKAGGSWQKLAAQYSTDPSTKDKGGELGFFSKGQMVPQFQNAAFGAKVGQIVGPVKSPFGYHIIQVEAKHPPQKATFAAVKDQIRQQLVQQQEQQQIPLFLQSLRAQANIQVQDPRYADAFPSPPPTPAAAPAASAAAPASSPAAAAPKPSGT